MKLIYGQALHDAGRGHKIDVLWEFEMGNARFITRATKTAGHTIMKDEHVISSISDTHVYRWGTNVRQAVRRRMRSARVALEDASEVSG